VSDEATKPTDEAVLVVISKVKAYIRAKSGMNTSDGVVPILSERIRQVCDEAIESAKSDGRKTVLDRDVKAPEAPEPPAVA
jgi:hypothetical protein